MPNCDFYAALEDHRGLLEWLVDEGTCRIYELGSEPEKDLRQFRESFDVLQEFDKQPSVYLQLYVLGAGPAFEPRLVPLDPKHCHGKKFRYAAEGWGLVQLYLSIPREGALNSSHTNHNSEKRAKAWADTYRDMPSPNQWDFRRVSAFSSRLNREITRRSVGKLGSRPVLPSAATLWEAGVLFPPFKPGEVSLQQRKRTG